MDKNISSLPNTESLKNEHELIVRDKDKSSKISIEDLYTLIKERFNEDFVLQKKITLFDYFGGNPPAVYDIDSVGRPRIPETTNETTGVVTPEQPATGAFALTVWETPELSKYEFIEVYGITDDYGIVFIKVENPVNKNFCIGTPAIGSNYIFFKTMSCSCGTDSIEIQKLDSGSWAQNRTAASTKYGGQGIYSGQWSAGTGGIGTFKLDETQPNGDGSFKIADKGGIADYSTNRIAIIKVIGYY